ncbi:MAG: RNA polymerase sigma factor RpoH [Sutterellaceae bacterium]|nr:RNA polymerase sigma factor RpoH [Sutterellaceae bacterium]
MRKDDDFEVIDIDADDIEPMPEDIDGSSSLHSSAIDIRSRGAGALVPYQKANVPAVIPQLGDLEAFIRAANAAPILSVEEERSLALQLRDHGDLQAAQRLILSHLRLVISVARGYLGYGLPFADLIQEGNVGLMKAIKHYDPDRGVRLMTFSVHWIRSEIQEYIVRNWRLVKLATTKNQRKLFFNLRQMKDSDKTLTGDQALSIANRLDVKPEEVREMETRMSGGDTSIDYRYGTDDDDGQSMAPIDWLSDESQEPQIQLQEKDKAKLANEGLRNAIASLDERSRRVIQARWLNETYDGTEKPLTLQELAAELGVSAERVRQIEKKAIAKMREALLSQKDALED